MTHQPPEFKVRIPPELTAYYPSTERDLSRLLVVNRSRNEILHIGYFRDLSQFLSNSLLVLNDSRVIPARVEGRRPGGGKVEVLFLVDDIKHYPATYVEAHQGSTSETLSSSLDRWPIPGSAVLIKVLIKPSRRLKPGMRLSLIGGAELILREKDPEQGWWGTWIRPRQVQKGAQSDPEKLSEGTEGFEHLESYLQEYGTVPLPPYIKRSPEPSDRVRYQTIYARQGRSLAAPTAGLHFTPQLLEQLKAQGCEVVSLNLNISLGTFAPIRTRDLSQHTLHQEEYHLPASTADAVNRAKREGRAVVAVGTTVVRALEDAALYTWPLQERRASTQLFIYPPYPFRVVDRLITNFHRPDSSLLQLVAAFAGWELINLAYQKAVEERFRFFSYGDAMLIL